MKKNFKYILMLLIIMFLPGMNVLADDSNTLTCDNVRHLTQAYNSIRMIAPFLLIIFGSLDFFKAVVAGDVKKQQEARSKFPKRLIAFLLLIILPFIVSYIATSFGQYGSQNTSLFCCVVSNGSDRCNFTASLPDSSADSSDDSSAEITSDQLCNGKNYTRPITKTANNIPIEKCIISYYGECKSINLSNKTCNCSYTYQKNVSKKLCNSNNCGIAYSNGQCYYNVKMDVTENELNKLTNQPILIKKVKYGSKYDLYYEYERKVELRTTPEQCDEIYNGEKYCNGNDCVCIYGKSIY